MEQRELTLDFVPHPQHLRMESFDGTTEFLRVDHPVVDPLRDGAPTFGWEGDPRLCMYLDLKFQKWVLMRLEWDGEYRVVTVSPLGLELGPEEVNQLIRRLVEHDTRRGFRVKDVVDKHNAAIEREEQRQMTDRHEAVADRLGWAIKRDVGHHY